MVGAYIARDQDVVFGQDVQTQSYTEGEPPNEYAMTTNFYGQYVLEASGAKHYVGDSETQTCAGSDCPTTWSGYGATYPATDGTNWTGGNLYNTVSSSETTETDPNGNQIITSSSGWTDSIGRALPGSQSGPGAEYQTTAPGITVPGVPLAQGNIGNCPAGTTAARQWVVPAHNSSTETYYLCYTNFSYQTAFDLGTVLSSTSYGVSETSSTSQGYSPALLLSAVVLPNLTSYTFSYDQYLSLNYVSLPTGGSISYTWQNIPFGAYLGTTTPISRAVATRTLNPGNGQPSETWTYHWYLQIGTSTDGGLPAVTYPVWAIITDPAGNDEEHQLGGTDDSGTNYLELVETKVQSYAGCGPHDTAPQVTGYTGASGVMCLSSGGSLQKTVSYILSQYGSGGANVNTPPFLSNPLLKPTTTTVTLPTSGGSNLVSRTVITPTPKYGSCQLYEGLNLQPQPGVSNPAPTYQTISPCYSTNQTQMTTYYDFGVSAPGSLLRTDTTQYLWQDSSLGPSYLAANLINLVETQSTGFATTTYGYDQSGSPQGARGNLTSVTRTNSSGASPTTQTVYNSQGLPTLLTDANGNKTSIAAYQCSGAFPQQVIKPYQSSTTLSETTSYVYDCNTGLIASMTDPNNKMTSYSYNDPLNRLKQIQYPDGGNVQYNYGDTASPVNVIVLQALSSSTSKQTEYDVDGLGRLIHSKLTDGSNIYETDTNYDSMGRVASVSNPYLNASDPTYGWTTYAYDALSRKVLQTQPDNTATNPSVLQWCYNGATSQGQTNCEANQSSKSTYPWVDYSDETGRHWQQVSDGLGRMIAAMEPNSSNTPNLETDYGYDTLGNLLRVDQWGGSNGSGGDRVRIFAYDSLSRLLSATNPENGATGYSYDANSNVVSKTDARGVAINYTYDALNRLTTKSYANDPSGTPSVCFQYDQTTNNGVGRLFHQWTQKGTCPSSGSVPTSGVLTQRSILAYDPIGRVWSEQQCVLSNCTSGTTPYSLAYTYDLAGDITSYPNGISSIQFTNAYDSAARLLTVTSSWDDETHPPTLFSTPSYNPAGGLTGATYGAGLTLSRTYDKRFRVTGETDTGVVASPTSGSATVTVTGSEQSQ
jgi:YD repeat-containing protein